MPPPRLLLTLGDAAGVGPEVTAAALADPSVPNLCRPAVVGDPALLRRAADVVNVRLTVEEVTGLTDWPDAAEPGAVRCWDPTGGAAANVPPGAVSAAAGRAARDWLLAAADLCLAGHADGVVTAPLNKAALAAGGVPHPGHTEILAERCGPRPGEPVDVRMTLHLPPGPGLAGGNGLTVAHVTLHTSLASVPGLLTRARVAGTARLLDRFLARIGATRRRVGVCALNPHAGEGGLFGTEEEETIAPAVADARAAGIDCHGPLPADTLVRRAVAGEFDASPACTTTRATSPCG